MRIRSCILAIALTFVTALLSGCQPRADVEALSRGSSQQLLASEGEGYHQAAPGDHSEQALLVFPRDHGQHPGYRLEWWYLTANLSDSQGQAYGAQFTLFRLAMSPPTETALDGNSVNDSGWATNQLYMGHAAVSTPSGHRYAEKIARGGVGLTQVQAEPFVARIENWQLASQGDALLPMQLEVSAPEFGLDLNLSATPGHYAQPVLHGDRGFSRKHPDEQVGSYYYSLPHLAVAGELEVEGEAVTVTGKAWLDREWSSQFLKPEQTGWDWLSLHLPGGEALMAFRLRQTDGDHFIYGSWIHADGEVTTLDGTQLMLEPLQTMQVAGRALPLRWQVLVPEMGFAQTIRPLHKDQWMDTLFSYWEGAVHCEDPGVKGQVQTETETCRGYLELTGYPVIE